MDKPGWLERWGLVVLDKADDDLPEVTIKRALKWHKLAIFGAAVVGFFFSGLVAIFEIKYFEDPWSLEGPWVRNHLIYWSAAIGFTVIETYFLIKIGLEAVARFVVTSQEPHDEASRRAMCRAVIELPEPELISHGLNPRIYNERSSKLLWYIAYKLKYMASNFVAKMIARRILTRSGFRGYAPLVAAPVVALWNAWVMHIVLTEAKHRVVGKFLTDELSRKVEQLSEQDQELFDDVLAHRFVAWGRYDHNLHLLIAARVTKQGSDDMPLCDKDTFAKRAPTCSDSVRKLATVVLAYKRGFFNKHEKELLSYLRISKGEIKKVRKHITRLEYNSLKSLVESA